MKTKIFFLFLILVAFSVSIKAQLTGKKFELEMAQMGIIIFEFKESDYVVTFLAGDTIVTGNFEIENDNISFTNEKGPQACPQGSVGNYTFKLEDKELKMQLIEDGCSGRPNILTQVWRQVDE